MICARFVGYRPIFSYGTRACGTIVQIVNESSSTFSRNCPFFYFQVVGERKVLCGKFRSLFVPGVSGSSKISEESACTTTIKI